MEAKYLGKAFSRFEKLMIQINLIWNLINKEGK